MSFQLVALSLALLLALSNGQMLQIFEAAVPGAMSGWQPGPVLPEQLTLCRDHLPSPFSVVCIPDEHQSPSFAKFFVNGNFFRTERALPYVLSGDTFNTGAAAWIPDSELNEVKCVLSSGEVVSSTITFSCEASVTTPPPTTTAPTTTTTTTATTTTTTVPPPPTTTTATTDASSPPPADYCIYIASKSYQSKTGAWLEGEQAMQYKFDDASTKTDRAGLATLRYHFTPQYTARYALTLDLFSSDRTEHNDVWVEVVNVPLTLTSKSGVTQAARNGFNKAYHNKNGRARVVFSSDFDPHVLSTQVALQAGESYVVKIGGRSTKTALFGVILFPCDSFGCELVREWYWLANTCSA